MKWIIIVSVVCVFCTHRVLSGCRNNTFQWWHRFEYNFSLADNSACHDSPCNCSNSTVDCSSLNLTFVPFVGLESYRYLNLSNNSLTNISHRQFFSNVSRDVEVIDLFSNGLVYLSPDAFRGLHKLTMLLLGGLNHLNYKDLSKLLFIRSGISLDFGCMRLGDLPWDTFHNASGSNIKNLSLSWNQIPSLNLSIFKPLRKMYHLNLWRNEIYHLGTAYLPWLGQLDLQANRLYDFPQTCSSSGLPLFPSLKKLMLDQNMIECIDNPVCLPKLKFLSLSYNKILVFPSDMFSITRFPSLNGLKLMEMEGKIEKVHRYFINNTKVGYVTFKLNQVDFSKTVHEDAFAGCPHIWRFGLRGNNFGEVSEKKFRRLLNPMRHALVILDLGQVQMKQLSKNTFHGMENLTTLDLYGNDLSSIPDGVFDKITRLVYLTLDNNYFTRISEATFGPQLRKRLKTLTLSGNPFICDCDILWFQRWMKTNYEIFTDFHSYSYSCANADNITLPDFVLNEQACMLGSDAAAFTISITCVFILFFLLFSLFFRFRWHVRLWLYEACRSRGRQQRRLLRERRRFKYDLFVSYAEENLGWVEHRLIPVLEGQWGLRLCIHQRDFLPGKHIVDNISDCVEDSERILLVFSPFFARSEWCQFDLKLCQTCVMERDDVLVIVTLQTVGSRDMTGAMMAVLRTTTYIEWEDRDVEEGQGQDMFWERMRVAVEDTEGGI